MKKIYISADIEGVAGAFQRESVRPGSPLYPSLCRRMTNEVLAAVSAINDTCEARIIVKDAHLNGNNLLLDDFPSNCEIRLGWEEHPYMMAEGLDGSFDHFFCIGYHSAAGSGASPLSHTINSQKFKKILINGNPASELLIHYYLSGMLGVPLSFISGDWGICNEAVRLSPDTITVSTFSGQGNGILSKSPKLVQKEIYQGIQLALSGSSPLPAVLPASFHIEVSFFRCADAHRASFYPGAFLKNDDTIQFDTENYYDLLTLLMFI